MSHRGGRLRRPISTIGQLHRHSALLTFAAVHPVHLFHSVVPSGLQGLDMISEWASNIDPPSEHCIVVIQTGDNMSADAHFTLFEASNRVGSEFFRFHDTRNGPNSNSLKSLGKEIAKKCFSLRKMSWQSSPAGPKKRKTNNTRKFSFQHKTPDHELNSNVSAVCGPYSVCIFLTQ